MGEGGASRTWGIGRRWLRVSIAVFFWVTLCFLAYVVAADDVPRSMLISASINPLVAAGAWANLRQRTHADAGGLRLVGLLRTRRIGWPEVAAVTTDRTRWREEYLRVELTDGTVVRPVGVPASAAEELETMRVRSRA